MKKCLVLLSGGLDSATTLALAKSEYSTVYALSFSYGQKQSVELQAAERLATVFKIDEHRIAHIDLGAFSTSALTSKNIDVPKQRTSEEIKTDIPVTYVPARNTVFLAYALAWAEVLEVFDIFIGVNAVDYSGYPDCRPEFIQAFENLANVATRSSVTQQQKVKIHAPLLYLSKAEIILLGTKLGVDYSQTHSCYDPIENLACGACDACALRRNGFLEAGIVDPTHYAKE